MKYTINEMRDICMKQYNDNKESVDTRIARGIEENRKGACRIRFTDNNGKPVGGKKVKLNQRTHDFKYGANIFMLDEFEKEEYNKEYRRFFKEYFNLATVPFYWNTLEPEEGKPRYEADSPKIYRRPAPDLCVDYCEENGITPKLHCLVYDQYIPQWLHGLPLDEVKAKYEERFRQIAQRYSGRMFEFEVVNELLKEFTWKYKSPLSEERNIVEWSFELARKYFPDELLMINEGNPIQQLARDDYRSPYFLLVENALNKGVEIDRIGLQNHFFAGVHRQPLDKFDPPVTNDLWLEYTEPLTYFKGLDIIAELGLPLELTEVTVPTFGDSVEAEELQADMLKLWYSIWFSHPAVDAIVYWNTVDGYAHVIDTEKMYWNENNCRGGLWHHDLTPKKSAETLKKLFYEEWHTDLELVTDSNGYIDFRGFFGEYDGNVEGNEFDFEIHKNENNRWEIII